MLSDSRQEDKTPSNNPSLKSGPSTLSRTLSTVYEESVCSFHESDVELSDDDDEEDEEEQDLSKSKIPASVTPKEPFDGKYHFSYKKFETAEFRAR